MARRPLVLGHRGWRDACPENTLAGVRAAVAVGCEGVERDLHLSADGHVVVLHDADVDRTTDATGCVHAMTLDLLAEARRLGCQGIHALAEGLSRETVAAWQAEGFTVMIWTARDDAECRAMIEAEPDVIGTDCPDVLLRVRAEVRDA